MSFMSFEISVVTPTFRRPDEVRDLLDNLAKQTLPASEVILVDGAPESETATSDLVRSIDNNFPFRIEYIRNSGGTAIQRNVGIDHARGDLIAFIDDDVRLEEGFLKVISEIFSRDTSCRIGGVVGYRTNEHFTMAESERWRWYKRLKLLTVYEPSRYDFKSGYPINSSLQPPFTGTRTVDFMTTACAVWRREVFDSGLRFHDFFKDYGVLEDAHLSLRAAAKWILLQTGDARCQELRSPNGRVDRRKLGFKSVANYYFVFRDVAGPLSPAQKFRFWRFQTFELIRILASAIRRRNRGDLSDFRGRLEGFLSVMRNSRILGSK